MPPSHLRSLLNTFELDTPPWVKGVPLWLWGLLAIAVPMLLENLPYWFSLPLPYGTLIGPADPDPWLRLTIVRDWLTGGNWYSHLMLHSNAPWGGIATPWTRPLDIVIAILVFLQMHTAPIDIELIRAALLLPIIWMTLLIGGVFRIMINLRAAPVSLYMTIGLIVTMPTIWNYFGIGNSDHHAPLAALWVWALAPHLESNPSKRALISSGLILALMLWMSVEAMMLIAILFFFLGLCWLQGDPAAKRLPVFATATALGAIAAVLIERPPSQWFTPVYDSVSVVQAFALILSAIVSWMLTFSSPKLPQIRARIGAAIVDVGLIFAIIWRVFPLFFRGPMATVDPYIMTTFLPRITEAQPLDSESWVYVTAMLIQPFAAIAICIGQLRKRGGIFSPTIAALLLFVLIVTLSLYLVEVRWFYYLYPVVVITLAPWLAALYTPKHPLVAKLRPARWLNALPEEAQLIRRLPVLAVIFLMPIVLLSETPETGTANSRRIDRCLKESRLLIYGGKLETILGGKPVNLMAPTDLGGEILFWTPEHIVASNYHREGPGIRYLWESSKIKSETELRRYLAKRDIEALLICPDPRAPKSSLLMGLQNGTRNPPEWLSRVTFPSSAAKDSQPAIFRVKSFGR